MDKDLSCQKFIVKRQKYPSPSPLPQHTLCLSPPSLSRNEIAPPDPPSTVAGEPPSGQFPPAVCPPSWPSSARVREDLQGRVRFSVVVLAGSRGGSSRSSWFQIRRDRSRSLVQEGPLSPDLAPIEESEQEPKSDSKSPKFLNAFVFISSMSSGFDLSSMFESKRRRRRCSRRGARRRR